MTLTVTLPYPGEYVEASSSAASGAAAAAEGGGVKVEAPPPLGSTMLDKRAANQGKKSRKRTAPGEVHAEGDAQNGAGESDVKPDV